MRRIAGRADSTERVARRRRRTKCSGGDDTRTAREAKSRALPAGCSLLSLLRSQVSRTRALPRPPRLARPPENCRRPPVRCRPPMTFTALHCPNRPAYWAYFEHAQSFVHRRRREFAAMPAAIFLLLCVLARLCARTVAWRASAWTAMSFSETATSDKRLAPRRSCSANAFEATCGRRNIRS